MKWERISQCVWPKIFKHGDIVAWRINPYPGGYEWHIYIGEHRITCGPIYTSSLLCLRECERVIGRLLK